MALWFHWLSGVLEQGLAQAPRLAELALAPAPEVPFWQQFLKALAVLSALLGLFLLGLHLWKKTGVPAAKSPLIQILATHYLNPKKALIMVAVDQERFLLASAADQLTLLTALAPAAPQPTPEASASAAGDVKERL
jgi:flagellar biogenesis protein FliO